MTCETHKPACPYISNDKSMTSTENAEHKKGVNLFKRLKINSLLESKLLFSYILVSYGTNIRLEDILKETSQSFAILSSS